LNVERIRTTVALSPAQRRHLEQKARREYTSINAVVVRLIRETVTERSKKKGGTR